MSKHADLQAALAAAEGFEELELPHAAFFRGSSRSGGRGPDERRSRRFNGIGGGIERVFARSEDRTMEWSHTIVGDDPAADAAPFRRLLGDWSRALSRDDRVAHRYLLLLRFILANAVALALVGAAAGQGWIATLLAADQGGLVRAIVAVFLVGLVWSGRRALQVSRELNEVKSRESDLDHLRPGQVRDGQSRAILASMLRLKLASRIAPIRHLANSLVLLGLIGTVIGFIIALSGVRPEVASHASAIGPMVSTLIGGMSVALYTTLVGSLLHLWLMVNVRLLEGGTVKLLSATIEQGERHVRS